MSHKLLSKLPQTPDGKTGFPWTEETENLSILDTDKGIYPKISIVTPSYNQGQFLEETIRSVLLQNYPNLEYIIIDGGSTDNSIEIIQKYANYLTYWVSEKDNGQSDAINKGLKNISGNIWAYINSDDIYIKGTFYKVAAQFQQDPNADWVTGHAEYIDEVGVFLERLIPSPFSGMKETLIRWEGPRSVAIQVSNFMSTKVLKQYGFFDQSLHYCMDMEFGMRLLVDGITPKILPEVLAKARLHSQSKTVSQGNLGVFREEEFKIINRFLPRLSMQDQMYIEKKIAECRYFMDLSRVANLDETQQTSKFISAILWMLIQHPSYLSHRATWGLFRKALGLSKKKDCLSKKKGLFMSLGSVVLKIKQKYQYGLETAYYRDYVRYRILNTKPIAKTSNTTCEIHVLTSTNDWLNLIWVLKSFYHFSQRDYALCIHDDGTLTSENIAALRYHFPNARIVERKQADEKVLGLLESYPRCLDFRQTNHLSPKVFDFAAYLQSDRLLLLDSDVLFFQEPTELLRRIENPNYHLNTLNADIESAYTVEPETVKTHLGFDLASRVNSGLGLIHKKSLQLDWIEEFLTLPNIIGHFWRIEQTIYALCSSRFGFELLPEVYDVRLDRGINDSPSRHYVGTIRHLMYSEGIKHLVQNNFLNDLNK